MRFLQSKNSGSSDLPHELKFITSDSSERISAATAQDHSVTVECGKLEKSEMQRHYVMSHGINTEMRKQPEIVKRLNGICAQVLPSLSQEHQQRSWEPSRGLSYGPGSTPPAVELPPPSLPAAVGADTGRLSLSVLGSQAHFSKEDKNGHEGNAHRENDGEKLH
uniref:Groucho/TLE N-terminal Q-rich domain-containing protein n=1 Tax=Otolemur garnettii TaxID=30611 RepID=H0XHA0_OTOGA